MPISNLRWSLCLLLLCSGQSGADSIDISGQEPWESCGYCHGFDGVSASDRFPHLAGQQQAYLKSQLNHFRSGARNNDGGVMQTNAATLNEAEIEQVTDYFSRQVLPVSEPSANGLAPAQYGAAESLYRNGLAPAQYGAAESLYRNGLAGECAVTACKTCHGEQAHGTGAIPALAGQHSAYLSKQLSDFAGARRGRSATTMDHGFVRCLSPQQQQQLSQFLSTQ